eukprot:CAMPEP_0177561892 /NCGR_PEP_ID=MMETSP0369-20130122/72193_1 /TAXON_ID=447022 ORGANISM="Scrippsiella hangoei-like, Strain SHHI-4" /NCGR_SAMPLE_ID=MMETSP0369 /ASSEMBLY_ACC=CAM_ASM_000364 /LENGTH=60 /DNA_ID=CAMNT_0019048881 /DNA_START=43 /DNA_END=222 /DNA_ORIENTATION=+
MEAAQVHQPRVPAEVNCLERGEEFQRLWHPVQACTAQVHGVNERASTATIVSSNWCGSIG